MSKANTVKKDVQKVKGNHNGSIYSEIETITVEGSNSEVYCELLKHTPINDYEKKFKNNLMIAIEAGVKSFKVPICDSSISADGKLQFVPGYKPAVNYCYLELVNLAEKNGIRLGSKNEYCLFLGTMINRLMAECWSENDAWCAVCTDSTKLGHYCNSVDAKEEFELTGSRKIAGKCDLANTGKILKEEETGGFWTAGGCYRDYGNNYPLANLVIEGFLAEEFDDCVGWFVL